MNLVVIHYIITSIKKSISSFNDYKEMQTHVLDSFFCIFYFAYYDESE